METNCNLNDVENDIVVAATTMFKIYRELSEKRQKRVCQFRERELLVFESGNRRLMRLV